MSGSTETNFGVGVVQTISHVDVQGGWKKDAEVSGSRKEG